jgi:isoquinoline 1-oxidoreductase subunit beta
MCRQLIDRCVMTSTTHFNRARRHFLQLTVAAGSGLVLGFALDSKAADRAVSRRWHPSAWLQIDVDGSVTIMIAESEMGQGVLTSMPMLVAEELEVDWKQVRVEQEPVDPIYG